LYTVDKEVIISGICMECLPCKHNVMINNERKIMNGRNICELFQEFEGDVPKHFERYLDEKYKKYSR